MKFFYHLISLAVILHTALSGRNDGEPDYDPDDLMMNLRDDGRNDGEPDYDPEIVTFAPSMEKRDEGRNDGEPDYDGSNDFVHEHPYRMLIPDKFRGMMCKFLMHLVGSTNITDHEKFHNLSFTIS